MTRTPRFALIIVILVLEQGCTVGPDYHAPALPDGSAAPLVSIAPKLEIAQDPPDDWWRLYDDKQLDLLVERAFAANADLAVAEANLTAARALLEEARSGLYPATTEQAGAINGRDATKDEILAIDGKMLTNGWMFDNVLDISYELDLFGRVHRSIEASNANAEAASAARDAVKITVAAETARTYAEICALGEQIAVAHHSLAVVAKETEITVHRLGAGAGSEFDVVRAEAATATIRAAIPPLEGQRRAALFELAALLGVTPVHAPAEAEACTKPPPLTDPIPVGNGATLLARRPDVRFADRQLAAATARVGVATADLYPRISLTGLFGGASSEPQALAALQGLTWGIGPTISWNFPNQTGVRARIHEARAGADGALASFDSTVLRALKETETSLTAYDFELDHNGALKDAQNKARRAFDMSRSRFTAGAASALDVLAAEQTSVAADAAVAASDSALIQDQIGVFKALGGGWQRKRANSTSDVLGTPRLGASINLSGENQQ
jgi:NodT family efflux transporter outer membrane factor (OMF) lipoprotein